MKKKNWLNRALETFTVDCDEYSYLLRDHMSMTPDNWERAAARNAIRNSGSPAKHYAKCHRRLTFTTMNLPQFKAEEESWVIPF
jgi:hypothetical protein